MQIITIMIVCFSLFVSSLILFYSFLYSLSLLSFAISLQKEMFALRNLLRAPAVLNTTARQLPVYGFATLSGKASHDDFKPKSKVKKDTNYEEIEQLLKKVCFSCYQCLCFSLLFNRLSQSIQSCYS